MNASRRIALFFVMTALLLTVGAVHAGSSSQVPAKAEAMLTPDKALEMLKQGNERFVSGKVLEQDLLARVQETATGQSPFAAVVSCIDSRLPPEVVFDQGIGDLFVARVAGNFVNDDILGSLEFATKLSTAKLIVVMGHSGCGAVKGACDGAQLGLLTSTLANINPAVEAVKGDHTPQNSTNAKFVQAVAEMNVKMTMQTLRERSLVLREMLDSGDIAMVGAMYDIGSGKVVFMK